MQTRKGNISTLHQFKEMHYGKRGTKRRDELEAGYHNYKIGILLHVSRFEKGLTYEELADKVDKCKS